MRGCETTQFSLISSGHRRSYLPVLAAAPVPVPRPAHLLKMTSSASHVALSACERYFWK